MGRTLIGGPHGLTPVQSADTMDRNSLDTLEEIFGLDEVKTTTSRVLTAPSGITNGLVTDMLGEFELKPIMRDLGFIVAREIADQIEAMALRPADYAQLPDLAITVAQRLMHALALDDETFATSLVDNLKMRG